MSSLDTAQLITHLRRRVPDGVRASVGAMAPYAHTATEITFRWRTPYAGTVLGVHLPRQWSRLAAVISARWVTGENTVVSTLDTGAMVPAGALRLQKFWAKQGEVLEIRFAVPPSASPNAPQLTTIRQAYPVILLVEPAQSGLAKAVRWVSGGLAKVGRSADAY